MRLVLGFLLLCAFACTCAQPSAFLYGDATGDLSNSADDVFRRRTVFGVASAYFPNGMRLPATFRVLGKEATHFTAHPSGWIMINSTTPPPWIPATYHGLFQPPFPLPSTSTLFGVAVSLRVGNGTDTPLFNPIIYFSNDEVNVSSEQLQSIASNKQKANQLIAAAFPSLSPAFVASDIFVFTFVNTTHLVTDFRSPSQTLPFVSTLQFVLVSDGSRTFSISHYPSNNLQCAVFAGIAWGSEFVSFAPPGSSPHPSLMDSRDLNRAGNAATPGSIVARVDTSVELPPVSLLATCSRGSCDDQNECTTESCLPDGTCSSSFTGDSCSNSSIPAKCALRVCDQDRLGCTVYDGRSDPSKQCFHPDPCVISSCDESVGCVYVINETCNNPSFFSFGPGAGDQTAKFPSRNLKNMRANQVFHPKMYFRVDSLVPFVSQGYLMTDFYLVNNPAVGVYDPSRSLVRAMFNLQGSNGGVVSNGLLTGVMNGTSPISEEEARLGLTPNVMYHRQMTRLAATSSQLREFELCDRVVQSSFGDKAFQTRNLIVVTAYRTVSGVDRTMKLPHTRQVAIAYNGPHTYVLFTGQGPDTRAGSQLTNNLPGITFTGENDIIRPPTWTSYGTNTGNTSLSRLFAFRADVSLSNQTCPCYDGDWCTQDTCSNTGDCFHAQFDCVSDQDCVASYCNQPEGCAAGAPNCYQTHDYLDIECTKSTYSTSEPVDCIFVARNATNGSNGSSPAVSFDTFFNSLTQRLDGNMLSLLQKTNFIEYDANRPGGGGYARSFRLFHRFNLTGSYFISSSASETNSTRIAVFSVFATPFFYGVSCDNQVIDNIAVVAKGSTLSCTLTPLDANNVNVLARVSDLSFDESRNPSSVLTPSSFTNVPIDGLARNFSFSVSLAAVGRYVLARNASHPQATTIISYESPSSVVVTCRGLAQVGSTLSCSVVAQDSNGAPTYSLASSFGVLTSSSPGVATVSAQPSPAASSTFSFQYTTVSSGEAVISSTNGAVTVSHSVQVFDIPAASQTSLECPSAVVAVGSTINCVLTPRKNNAVIYTTASQISAFSSSSPAVTLGVLSPVFGNALTLPVTGASAGPAVINSSTIAFVRTVTAYLPSSSVQIECPFSSISPSQGAFNCTVTPYHSSTPNRPTYGLWSDVSISCLGVGSSGCSVSGVLPRTASNRFTFEVVPSGSAGSLNITATTQLGSSSSAIISVCSSCARSAAVQSASLRLNTSMPSNPQNFIQGFINDICTATAISCSRVVVSPTLRSGSVIVDFAILPAASGLGASEPSPLAVIQDLQQQLVTPGSALLSGSVTSTAYPGSLSSASSSYVNCDNTWKLASECSVPTPNDEGGSGVSGGAIAGIVIGCLAGAVLVAVVILHFTGHLRCGKSDTAGKPQRGIPDGLSLESNSGLSA